MVQQTTLAVAAGQSASLERYRERTRRDEFLTAMNGIVPWAALCEVIRPHYPKSVGGRPPIGLERMLRIHFFQQWLDLADEVCEQAPYDSASLCRFVGINLGRELPGGNKPGKQLFAKFGEVTSRAASSSGPALLWTPRSLAHPTRPRLRRRGLAKNA